MDNFEQQIYALKEAQANKLVNDLNAKKQESLTALGQQEQIAKQTYQGQRESANISSQQNKLNFATFLANRGQTNFGIANAAELSRQNVLGRNISNIGLAENQAINTINQGRLQAQNEYNTGLASGNASIEADIATKLLNYREQLRQEQLAREEQLRKEALAAQQDELNYQRDLAKIRASKSGSGSGNTLTAEPIIQPTTMSDEQKNDLNLLQRAAASGKVSDNQLQTYIKVYNKKYGYE